MRKSKERTSSNESNHRSTAKEHKSQKSKRRKSLHRHSKSRVGNSLAEFINILNKLSGSDVAVTEKYDYDTIKTVYKEVAKLFKKSFNSKEYAKLKIINDI